MNKLNNNIVAVFAVLLILFSIIGQIVVNKKVDEIENLYGVEEVTGKISATGTVSFSIIRSLSDINFHAELANDNQTVILFWENISQANVSVYITNNLSEGFNYGSPNTTGITAFNWSDPTSSSVPERYYKIGIWYMGIYNISKNTAGKYDINLTTDNGRWNYISLPFEPYNSTLSEVLKSIGGKYDWLYEYIPSSGSFDFWFETVGFGSISDLQTGKCYIIQSIENTTLTVVGEDLSSINETLLTDNGRWNYVGWINDNTDLGNATASISGNYDWMYEYIPSSGSFDFWFDTVGFGSITHLRPGRCYIIQPTVNNTNLEYTK